MSDAWWFDAGNTRLKIAGPGGARRSLAWDDTDFAQQLAALLPAHAQGAYVASVASPSRTGMLLDVLAQRFGRVGLARTESVMRGLRIAYAQPAHLGVDRFLVLLGRHVQAPAARLVVSVGTALTLDWVRADGTHVGGRILPSPTLMRQSLAAISAALPSDAGDWAPDQPFATDTVPALSSGCEGAAVAVIQESLARAQVVDPAVVLEIHGGGADALRQWLPVHERLPDDVVLRGLAAYFGVK